MLAVKSMDIRDNFKDFCDMVFNGETIIVSRPKNENIYMINEKQYNELQKAKRNADYLVMIDESIEQLKSGKIVVKTMAELEQMANG